MSDQVNGKWYFGYVAGFGLDYALTQNIFLRGEYRIHSISARRTISGSARPSVRIGAGLKF